MLKKFMLIAAVPASLSVVALAMSGAGKRVEREDCPGQITCPLTGELVCEDQCSAAATDQATQPAAALPTDPARADCPGLITCPLTGELICEDECRANAAARDEAKPDAALTAVPSCCQSDG